MGPAASAAAGTDNTRERRGTEHLGVSTAGSNMPPKAPEGLFTPCTQVKVAFKMKDITHRAE